MTKFRISQNGERKRILYITKWRKKIISENVFCISQNGEKNEFHISRNGKQMLAKLYQNRQSLVSLRNEKNIWWYL